MMTPVKDSQRPGCPRKHLQHARKIQQLLANDHRMTLAQLSEHSGLSRASVHRLLKKDLNMSKLSPKFVPRILTPEQKRHRVDLCTQNLAHFRRDTSLLEKVITTDESWFHVFDLAMKQGSAEWRQQGGGTLPSEGTSQQSSQKDNGNFVL